MSFDFINSNGYRNTGNFGAPVPNNAILDGYGIPIQQDNKPVQQNPISFNFQNNNQQIPNNTRPAVDPRLYDTPKIVTDNSSFKFTVKDNNSHSNTDIKLDEQIIPESRRRGPGRPRKDLPATQSSSSIVRPDNKPTSVVSGTVENVPTSYTYMETTAMLHGTLNQIDAVSNELMGEFEMVRANRAMKNKYGVLNGLSENIGALISNKIAAIKEINNSISKSNDLDYKRYRDNKDALNNQNDDKYISDLYTSFLNNNNANIPTNIPTMNSSIYGSSGIVRADIGGSQNLGNMQYTNYIANITPEERLMLLEGNNNIRQAMVYDPSTGNRAFQYFDFSNPANPIPQPGLPCYSDTLLDEFTIDLANRKAKSINLKETMDLVIANSQQVNTY